MNVNWTQLKLIFWLRWRLTRNQWARSKHGLGPFIAVLMGTATGIVGALSFFGGLFGAANLLRDASPDTVMQVWLVFTAVFLFMWLVGLMAALQRTETIDLQRLMHLPVALGQIFFINYLASHLSFTVFVTVPAALGLSIGLVIARGPMMLLLLPLVFGMIFMITAWTYCLQGWLAAMMSNPRRRRTIIMGVTLAFVLVAQAPNLYFNVLGRAHSRSGKAMRHDLSEIAAVQQFVPPFWVSVGARALAEGRSLPALWAALGCLSIGAIGLRRAYRNTVKSYLGATGGKAPVRRVPPQDAAADKGTSVKRDRLIDLRLPGVPDEASAVAAASFRSILRAPEVKITLAAAFVVPIILGASLMFRAKSGAFPESLKPFLAPGAIAFSLMMLVQFFANQFGLDRDGFCAFVLSPVNRRWILFGKNLATLPIIYGAALFLLILVVMRLKLPPLTILATLFQIATMSIILSLYGNLLSIYAPYRIQQGSLKPTKVSGPMTLAIFLGMMIFPVAMSPVFLPPLIELLWRAAGMPGALPVNLLLSICLAALAALVYWQLLPSLGRLLQRRETRILEIVTAEVE